MKSNLLPTDYQNFIALSRYARWLDDEQRRETWTETVSRYFDYMQGLHGNIITKSLRRKLEDKILGLEVMPSMRALMTAGPALKTCNVTSYNCSYIPVDSVRAFDECMYILMCGTGVGFSVERSNVDKLPIVNEHFEDSSTIIKVADSRSGWAKSLRELIAMLYVGQIPTLDVSDVRPAGAKLKTMGGRASGPAPLIDLYNFCVGIFKGAKGRRLYPIECHDLMCKIGEVVVVGGVRRSALISLSNLGDDQMRHAKSGKWWDNEGQRSLANNSVAYKTKPDMGTFMREWLALYESHSGERGIFNRQAAINKVKENGRRKASEKENPVEPEDYIQFGCNPCSEIILRPYQFCNLTEVVCRATDTIETLKEKVEIATILGTLQSTLTDFKYLRKVWKQNTEEERLLGVSLTGILDCPILAPNSVTLESTLEQLREVAVQTNKKYAKMLDIPQSTAITCVKPSGTVSQLVDSASGIHARHSEYYIRTVRGGNTDPLTQFMKDVGIPAEPDLGKPTTTTVFSFPTKSPSGAVTRTEMTAIDQLQYWLVFQRHWCEHKPSVTISVKESEWMEVGAWVYKNFDEVSGISFLPFSEHTYQQAPYQDINEEQYNTFLEKMPNYINWSLLKEYEKEDTTIGSKEFACTADSCEIVDIQ
jgi:ribonucleoside-diphosphate reductase alpha chain